MLLLLDGALAEVEKSRQVEEQISHNRTQPAETHEANKATPPLPDDTSAKQGARKEGEEEGGKSIKKTPTKSLSGRQKSKSIPTSTPPASTTNGHAAKGGESNDNDFFAAAGFSPSESGDAPKTKPKPKSKLKTTKKVSGTHRERERERAV